MTPGILGHGGWSVLPTVTGVVTFDDSMTLHELEVIDGAEVRVTMGRGGGRVFSDAAMMNPSGGPPYAIHFDCYGPAS